MAAPPGTGNGHPAGRSGIWCSRDRPSARGTSTRSPFIDDPPGTPMASGCDERTRPAHTCRESGPTMMIRSTTAMVAAVLALTACTAPSDKPSTTSTKTGTATTTTGAVTGNVCPQVLDASEADFYPIQPSFSAGYTVTGAEAGQQHRELGIRRRGRLPLLPVDGLVPVRHQGRAAVQVLRLGHHTRRRLDEPLRRRQQDPRHAAQLPPLLDAARDPRASVVSSMQSEGKNVALLPASSTTPGRLDRVPQLLVVLQRRARRLRPLRLRRADEHPGPDDHRRS